MARCPSCARFFCRECVTEHDGRLACAECLRLAAAPVARAAVPWRLWLRPLGALAGLLLAWMIFYYAGQLLTRVPPPARTAAAESAA